MRLTLNALGSSAAASAVASGRRVVHAREHDVLDEHLSATQLDVATAFREHVRERIAVVDRHELGAFRRVGCMEREREPDRLVDLVDEAAQPGHPADGRDRRAAVGDPEVGKAACRREHLVDVEERLSHPHVHGVVRRLPPTEVQRLVEDLRGGQVATEAHRARRAERARERAARLRREAERAPSVAVAHEHGLDRMPVVPSGRAP